MTARAVLLACPAPHKIRENTLEKFVSLVREVFRGRRLKLRKLRELHRLAQESIGIPVANQTLVLELRVILQLVKLLRVIYALLKERRVIEEEYQWRIRPAAMGRMAALAA